MCAFSYVGTYGDPKQMRDVSVCILTVREACLCVRRYSTTIFLKSVENHCISEYKSFFLFFIFFFNKLHQVVYTVVNTTDSPTFGEGS